MGNLISKFRQRFCRWRRHRPLPRGHHAVVFPVHCDDAPPGRDHPAAPAPVLGRGHRLTHRHRAPVASGFSIAPRRRCPLPQTTRFPVGVLPLVNWKDPPKKPVLSARNSGMFGPSRRVYIPPARRGFPVLPSPPEQGVLAEKPGPSRAPPCPCPKEVEVKVHAGSPEWAEKNRNNLVPNKEQKDQNSPDKSGDLPLTPRSGETKGVLTSGKRSTEEALSEEQRPHWPASPTLCKGMGGEGPSGSSSAAPSASRMLRKRKRSEPLLQPLPPLLWDPGELPPPCLLYTSDAADEDSSV